MKRFVLSAAVFAVFAFQSVAFAIGLPDMNLTKAELSVPMAAAGESLSVNVQVTNSGDSGSPAYTVGVYLSKDNILDLEGLRTDTLLISSNFPVLSAGATYPPDPLNLRRMDVTLPAATANGYYYIIIKVDPAEVIDENSERNNQRALALIVAPYLCYDKVPGESGVCSDHGNCKGANFCSCLEGWKDDICSTPICTVTCGTNSHCSAPDTCTCNTGYVDTDHGCQDERCANKADWAECVTGDLPSACFAERCEVLAVNDTCTTASVLDPGTTVNGSLWGAHPYQIVKDPVTNTIYEGRDAFHSFAAEKDTCYKIVLEMGSDLTGMGAIWKDCNTLDFFSAILSPTQSAAMDLCTTSANTYIIQVLQQPTTVRKRPNWNYHLQASSIGCRIGALRCTGDDAEICDEGNTWTKKETCAAGACLEGVCGCENDAKQCDPTDVDKACSAPADCGSGLCLGGKCVSTMPMTCVAHIWKPGVSCDLDREFCEAGACKERLQADGDLDEESEAPDGDSEVTENEGETLADGDSAEETPDGDVNAETDNDTTATDGDTAESDSLDTDSVTPIGGSKGGGGCQTSGGALMNSLLLAFLAVLWATRRRTARL